MQKTVNQWLDWIDNLPKEQSIQDEIRIFRNKLGHIKSDEKYNGFGGAVNVILPKKLEKFVD